MKSSDSVNKRPRTRKLGHYLVGRDLNWPKGEKEAVQIGETWSNVTKKKHIIN